MALNHIRLVVVTTDNLLYRALSTALLKSGKINALSCVAHVALAEGHFEKHKANALLIDTDSRDIANSMVIKRLTEKYRLLIMLTGATEAAARVLMRTVTDIFVLKPDLKNPLAVANFTRFLANRTESFASASKMRFDDLLKTVNENGPLIAVASSTGGTGALEQIIKELPAAAPPMLVVQHMPSGFTKLFATRLNGFCRMMVKEAAHGEFIKSGTVYIAPAGFHMTMEKSGAMLRLKCFAGTKVHGVMPAADVLFESVAPIMKARAMGIILTGMGADGARGLMQMHAAGARTIGQSKETCVVYGMPKVAKDLGAIDQELPLPEIARAVINHFKLQ